MKSLSFRYKLFLALSVLILFYAIGSVFFVDLSLKKALKKNAIDHGKSLSATLSSHLVDEMLIKDFVGIFAFFEHTMRNNPEVSYIFIEKDGAVLLHTFQGGFPKGLLNIGHKKNELDYVSVKGDKETYYDFSAPIFGGKAGNLRLGMSDKMITEMLSNIIKSLIYIAFAVVVAALGFSMIISRKLINPLSTLTASAIEVADGNYSKTIEIFGSDEIGKLSHAFSRMAYAVRIREKELIDINKELETVNKRLYEYINELNKARDELIKLSITDELTGLYNRRYLTERLEDEFYESKRYGREFSLMMIDIDSFKRVNDTYGHLAGDEVLRQVARILENERRKSDIVGRFGGEEFVIAMPHIGIDEAFLMAERIRKRIEENKFDILSGQCNISVSIGLASVTHDMQDIDMLLKIADNALYSAKTQGKGRTIKA